MTSRYTNMILTIIAVLLVGLLLKGNSNFSIEENVSAQTANYTQFRVVSSFGMDLDKTLQDGAKGGWKPFLMSQSHDKERNYPSITVILAK